MELSQTIQRAGDLTQLLQEALDAHDQDLCDDLLARRELAMADFNKAHQEASPQEKERCQDGVRALAETDLRLQDRSHQLLTQVKGEFRGQLGQSAQGKYSTRDENAQACLDKKA